MKNVINYFYGMIIDNIHQNELYYYFDYNNEQYVLTEFLGDPYILTELYKLHLSLLRNGIYVHQIILNKDNNIVCIVNGTPYVLMKVFCHKGKINFNTILSWLNVSVDKSNGILNRYNYSANNYIKKENQKISLLERNNLAALWSNKNDYLEYQISQLGQQHQVLRDSFSYYIGLGEVAICLANSIPQNMMKIVCHRRVHSNETVFDFYNPLNLIIDERGRDVAEYLKNRFFDGFNIDNDLNMFFINGHLTREEYLIFFARMLYPTYYFDLFEDVISGKKNDEDVKKITDLSSNYELFLKKLYNYYRRVFNIEPIEWLE